MKIKEINAFSSEDKNNDISLTSNWDSAHIVAMDDMVDYHFIIDLGSYLHVIHNRDRSTSYDVVCKNQVCLSDGYACEIVGVEDVHIKFQHKLTFTLKNMIHVTKLNKRWSSIE